ncbi:DNA-methyltransferase [Elusimicrobiota bacterium]
MTMGLPIDQVLIGECAEVMRRWPNDCIDAVITSPPFETMRRYSDDPRDLGNHQGLTFIEQLRPTISEWWRILKPTGNLLLNFQPQTVGGVLSPTSYLLPQALIEAGFHIAQELWVVKTNAMPNGDPRLLKPCVERVIHAVKNPTAFIVFKDAVRRPPLWAHRDNRPWKYAVAGADGGNFLCPALDRLNRLSIREILSAVCGEDTNALPIAKTQNQTTIHPAKMSDEVARWLVLYGSPPEGMVCDPFCGSGTSLIQTRGLGRHYVGVDLNEEYVKQARTAVTEISFSEFLTTPTPQTTRDSNRSPGARPRPPRTQIPRSCRNCGKDFSSKKAWAEFCSDPCRYKFHNDRRRRGNDCDVEGK